VTVSLLRSDRLRSWKFQPTPLRVDKIGAILASKCAQTSFRSISGGAADGQTVGPLYACAFARYDLRMIHAVTGWVGGKPRLRKLTADECAIVIQQLTHPRSRLRWMAADLLGKQRASASIDALIVALRDSHWLVRLHAAKALGRISDPRAFTPLCLALHDNHRSVRRRAVTAVGQLGDARAITEVLRVLQRDPTLRNDVATSLTLFMTLRTADALMRTATRLDHLPTITPSYVHLLTPLCVMLLKWHATWWQYTIVRWLGQNGDARAIPVLRIFSRDPRSPIQGAAYGALGDVEYRHYCHLIPAQPVSEAPQR
jgi:HEAT repeat protein